MALFLSIIRHGAAECAAHNEYYRKALLEGMPHMEDLAKKLEIKIVGSLTVHPKHLQVNVYDAPNFEALMALFTEPPMQKVLDTYDWDLWPCITREELAQILMQA
jgi:hypothetical protein